MKSLHPLLKIVLPVIAILIVAQCSASPYIIDNETYYIQSIKWLNEYGFAKGLSNLHPFLAQMSGWHVAQSAFSFWLLYDKFNDLSGFCLLVGNFFAITKLNAYFKNRNKLYLVVGLLPIANVFLFQFISAPSPDLPVYIFTFIIVFYFVKDYKVASAEAFKLMALLAAFCFYIKPTSIALLLFPLLYFATHFNVLKGKLLTVVSIGCLVLLAFTTKNSMISGYPVFPFTAIAIDADYTLPKELADFYVDMTRRYAFHLSSSEFEEILFWELFKHWLSLPGLHGFFNKLAIAFIAFTPAIIYKFNNKKAVWVVYGIMCLQMLFLYLSSPQYRFFFNFILVFSLLFSALVFTKKKFITAVFSASTAVTAFILFVPINLSFMTQNNMMDENSTFSLSTIISPAKNSGIKSVFVEKLEGNLNYYSPEDSPNFWITGDAPLPAVSRSQVEYFRKKYRFVPQLRGDSMGDGFYSKRTSE